MISLYALIFLGILGSAAANPTLALASNSLQRRSNTKGHITCVEPQIGGHVYNLSSAFDDNYLYLGTNTDNFLEVEISLDAATKGSVNIATLAKRTWAQALGFRSYYSFLGAVNSKPIPVNLGQTGEFANLGGVMKTQLGAQGTKIWQKAAIFRVRSMTFCQSAIWRYEPATRRLMPRWVDEDKTTPNIHVFYDDTKNIFGLTGNISAFQELHYPVRECDLVFNEF